MSEKASVRNLGRAIRPYLRSLLGAKADRVDAEVASALARDDGATDEDILRILTVSAETHSWAARYLETGVPPELTIVQERGFEPLPGLGEVVLPPRYDCPSGDYTWYRRRPDEPVPECPTHGVRLGPVPSR